MSNLDFMLNCIEFAEEPIIQKLENGNTKVLCILNGSEDLSWNQYEYIFDDKGNYLSYKEINSYY